MMKSHYLYSFLISLGVFMNTSVNSLPHQIEDIKASEILSASYQCFNYDTNFAEQSYGWLSENSARDTYEQKPDGIQMNLVAPLEYVRLNDELTRKLKKN